MRSIKDGLAGFDAHYQITQKQELALMQKKLIMLTVGKKFEDYIESAVLQDNDTLVIILNNRYAKQAIQFQEKDILKALQNSSFFADITRLRFRHTSLDASKNSLQNR